MPCGIPPFPELVLQSSVGRSNWPATTPNIVAKVMRNAVSGIFAAIRLPITMPGIEPARRDTNRNPSNEPKSNVQVFENRELGPADAKGNSSEISFAGCRDWLNVKIEKPGAAFGARRFGYRAWCYATPLMGDVQRLLEGGRIVHDNVRF